MLFQSCRHPGQQQQTLTAELQPIDTTIAVTRVLNLCSVTGSAYEEALALAQSGVMLPAMEMQTRTAELQFKVQELESDLRYRKCPCIMGSSH